MVHCDLKHMKQKKCFFFLCQVHLTIFILQSDRAEASFLGLVKFSALFKVCITFRTSKGLAYASFLLGHLSESPRFWLMSLKDIFTLAVTSIFIIHDSKLICTNFLQPWLLIHPEAPVSASLGLALSPATDIECDVTPLLSFC